MCRVDCSMKGRVGIKAVVVVKDMLRSWVAAGGCWKGRDGVV